MIKISTRLLPFSHLPGIRLLLPKSSLELQIYPTLLRVGGREIELELQGPVFPFTVEQDLERGLVRLFGQRAEGFFALLLEQRPEGVVLRVERLQGALTVLGKRVVRGDELVLEASPAPSLERPHERLFLGSHRALEWEAVEKRRDLTELLPLLHRMSLWLPPVKGEMRGGTRALLDEAVLARRSADKIGLTKAFERLLLCAFEGMLVPRLSDPHKRGLILDEGSGSPLYLLRQGGALVRSLFFEESEEAIVLLPCLLPALHAGRFMGLTTRGGARLNLEWTKGAFRLVEVEGPPQTVVLALPKGIRRFRLRHTTRERGKFHPVGTPLELKGSGKLYLDRFET